MAPTTGRKALSSNSSRLVNRNAQAGLGTDLLFKNPEDRLSRKLPTRLPKQGVFLVLNVFVGTAYRRIFCCVATSRRSLPGAFLGIADSVPPLSSKRSCNRLREPGSASSSPATYAPSSLEQSLYRTLDAASASRRWIEMSSNQTPSDQGLLARRHPCRDAACSAHDCQSVTET
jgi:hypothetical protein